MKTIQKINDIISATEGQNKTGDIYINAIHNEFVMLKGSFNAPSIPVKEIDNNSTLDIIQKMCHFIPEFTEGHIFSEKKIPPSEQHFIHLVRPVSGKIIPFVHVLKFDMKFGGDPSGIIKKGTTDFYPSYKADRIYYKSRLVPGELIFDKYGNPEAINSIKIKPRNILESDQYFHTFAVFDEIHDSELSLEYIDTAGRDLFTINPSIYSFLSHDYMTCCMNILKPTLSEILESVKIFEPLFLKILSSFREISELDNFNQISTVFDQEIESRQPLKLTDAFSIKIKEFYSRYSLTRDEELVLKGWWRITDK